jgi:hypothetical protein
VDVCLCVMMEVEVVSFGQSLYSMSEWEILAHLRQRRRGKYLLTKLVRGGTYLDLTRREVPRSHLTYDPCANNQTPLYE